MQMYHHLQLMMTFLSNKGGFITPELLKATEIGYWREIEMKFNDNRVFQSDKFELGDVIRGLSGTYYMIIKVGSDYKLLDIRDGLTRFTAGSIERLITTVDRDEAKTHIKKSQIEVTFK